MHACSRDWSQEDSEYEEGWDSDDIGSIDDLTPESQGWSPQYWSYLDDEYVEDSW